MPQSMEDAHHLFIHYPYSSTIWSQIFRLFGILGCILGSYHRSFMSVIHVWLNNSSGSWKNSRGGITLPCVLWALWQGRNNRKFKNIASSATDLIQIIKRRVAQLMSAISAVPINWVGFGRGVVLNHLWERIPLKLDSLQALQFPLSLTRCKLTNGTFYPYL